MCSGTTEKNALYDTMPYQSPYFSCFTVYQCANILKWLSKTNLFVIKIYMKMDIHVLINKHLL